MFLIQLHKHVLIILHVSFARAVISATESIDEDMLMVEMAPNDKVRLLLLLFYLSRIVDTAGVFKSSFLLHSE